METKDPNDVVSVSDEGTSLIPPVVTDDTDENSNSKKKESTRTYIAQLYVWAYFITVLFVFITGWCLNFNVDDFKDLLIAISGTLSGPLGFIVGYYFKASKE